MNILKGSRQLAVISLAVLIVLLLSLPWTLADASPPLMEWNRTFGGSEDEIGWSVQVTSDGGYIITGQTRSFGAGGSDVCLVKTDSQGETEWIKTFGGSTNDIGRSVQETSDGGYIIAGSTDSFGAGEWDVYLVKADSEGIMEWNRTFGDSRDDFGYSVQVTSDGGYIITGYTYSFLFHTLDVYLVKTDSMGLEEWSTTFGGHDYDAGYSVQVTSDGGYIIAGGTATSLFGGTDVYLEKVNSLGGSEWSRTFGDSSWDEGYSVQVTSDGGYIITGTTVSPGAGGWDVYLVKTDSEGIMEWSTTFGGYGEDKGYSVQETSDGGYIITGKTTSFGAGDTDVYLVKTDSLGEMEWNTTFGGSDHDIGYSVQETSDGRYIITGHTTSFGAGWYDVYLVKTDSLRVEEETYSASIIDLVAPSEATVGETFTVNITVSYEFTNPTQMRLAIRDVNASTWIANEGETLVGEGTKTYSFELTAPAEESTWALGASVEYLLEYEWTHDEEGYRYTFDVSVVEEENVSAGDIALFEGWNNIGLPFTPVDPSIEVVLADILDNIISVWAFNGETKTWSSYSPGAPSSLNEMVVYRGYWIKVTEDATLTVHG